MPRLPNVRVRYFYSRIQDPWQRQHWRRRVVTMERLARSELDGCQGLAAAGVSRSTPRPSSERGFYLHGRSSDHGMQKRSVAVRELVDSAEHRNSEVRWHQRKRQSPVSGRCPAPGSTGMSRSAA